MATSHFSFLFVQKNHEISKPIFPFLDLPNSSSCKSAQKYSNRSISRTQISLASFYTRLCENVFFILLIIHYTLAFVSFMAVRACIRVMYRYAENEAGEKCLVATPIHLGAEYRTPLPPSRAYEGCARKILSRLTGGYMYIPYMRMRDDQPACYNTSIILCICIRESISV